MIFFYIKSPNFDACEIIYDENDYIISCFKNNECITMMIYLLAYAYDKDSYSHCKRQAYRHKNKNVIRKFQYMINDNYAYDLPTELDNII